LAPGEAGFESPPISRLRLSESQDDLQKAALSRRPDLLRARLQIALADREAARAAAERFPDLRLGPAVNASSGGTAVGLMLAIPLPLFGTGAGPYREALARREGAVETYRQTIRETASRVAEELNRLQAGQTELDELIGEVSGAVEGALELAQVRYGAGKLDVLRLLSIHRAFSSLKLEYLNLLLAQREVLIDLQGAVGRPVKTKEVMP
jgi:outer membrane protein TolC